MDKAYILDTNLPAIYSENVNLKNAEHLLRRLSNDTLTILSTNAWYDQAIQICQLLDIKNIDIVSGAGSCLKKHYDNHFFYESFLNKNDVDLILHLAVSSFSGVLVKGQWRDEPNSNVLLNYFLSVQTANQFKSVWKLNFPINNDYLLFEKNLEKLDVSEIYVYSSGQSFNSKFLKNDNEPNDLIKECNLNIVHFFDNLYLFNSKTASKFKMISNYLDQLGIPLKDVTYISLKEFDSNARNAYGKIIIPEDSEIVTGNTSFITYNSKRLDEILDK
ncbi:MPN552 family protein [Mycoplasmoides alvi]|uniref:MPN552 family protein n=1 Tax=Mycoplasmoides alvi TaxID=78580 RepID=UPI00051C7EE1|nr:hypothetical protein [Mycoplasmoides alvi]